MAYIFDMASGREIRHDDPGEQHRRGQHTPPCPDGTRPELQLALVEATTVVPQTVCLMADLDVDALIKADKD